MKEMKKYFSSIFIFALSLCIGLYSCATNPVTQKQQFVLMSERQELTIGRAMDPQIIKKYGLYDDFKLQEYVNEVGQKLAMTSERPALYYHFKVLDSPVINAFALPGGYVYVTRGILALLNNEAELAGVLGHEVGHVTARHAVQQYTQTQSYQILATVASIFVPEFRNRDLQQLANVVATGIIRGYGRKMEMESDRLGMKYSFKTGYNPNAVPDFLKVLKLVTKEDEKESFHGFFATHPETSERIYAAQEKAKALLAGKNSADLAFNSDRYLNHIEGLIYGEDPKEGVISGRMFQHSGMQFEITYPEEWKIYNTKKAVVAKDKEKRGKYTSQLTVDILRKRITPELYAMMFFRRNRIRPLNAYLTKINNLEAYIAEYQIRNRKVLMAFILWQDRMFLFRGFSSIQDYRIGKKYFTQILHSFRGLSKDEAASIKPVRIKIYTVQHGDTIKSIAKKYNNDPQKIASINGFEKDDIPLKAGKKIKVLAND